MIRIKQTEDKELLNAILKQLEKNDHYCPCSLTRTQDDKCMCKSFRDQIERKEQGECSCGRYMITVTDD